VIKLCSADFRESVVIEENTTSVDTHGGLTNSWATRVTIWAQINDTGGGESQISGRKEATHSIEVITHYDSSIVADDRILFNSVYYEITFVEDMERRGVYTRLLATSEVL